MTDAPGTSGGWLKDQPLIKSYVWRCEECFYVSTIERDSSAAAGPRRFVETIVWTFDWATNERGRQVFMDSDHCGSMATHARVCARIFKEGNPEGWNDND